MILADKKQENNIAEYIIHMYKTEDLIRSFNFDLDRIKKDLISLLPCDDQEKEELKDWYETILLEMEDESIKTNGHLSRTVVIINELEGLFNSLVKEDETFTQIAKNARPLFDKSPKLSEVVTSINGMYAYLLLKSDNMPVPTVTEKSAEIYGEVLSYLSYKYKQKHYLSEN
jgi:hypothetical protein